MYLMDNLIYFAETDGISLERMVRTGKFNMKVGHFHNEYEIFFLIDGERQFFFGNRSYLIKSGSLILVDTNSIHMTLANNERETGHDRIILYVGKDKMKEFDNKFPSISLVKFFKQNYGVFYLNEEHQSKFMAMYENIQKEFCIRDRNYKSMIDMEIMHYFIQFIRDNVQHASDDETLINNTKYKTVYTVAEYISENYKEALTLESLADKFFLSKYYFCRSFKEITGYGVNEYINIHRIKEAKRLLEETDMSISEISFYLGYKSLTYFEKVFKVYMTISPLKYRKTLNVITYNNK